MSRRRPGAKPGWGGALPALAAAAAILIFYLGHSRIVDLDVFHEMALARAALAAGTLPTVDLFAFTPTVIPSVNHEWGMGFVLLGVSSLGGAAGLVALKYALGLATFALAVAAARAAGASWECASLLAPLGIAMADVGFTNVRAQFFSMLFLALLALLLQRDRAAAGDAAAGRGGAWRWIVPWLVAWTCWLNLHGGFVVGGVLLAAWAVEEAIRARRPPWRLLACGAAMAALVLVNPYGLDYVRYLAKALLMPRPRIAEWMPLWRNPALLVLLLLSLEVAAYAWWRRGLRASAGWLPLLLFAAAAVRHGRHLSLYAVLWTAFAPGWFDATPIGAEVRSAWARRRRLVAACALVATLLALGAWVAGKGWGLRVPADGAALAEGLPVIYPEGAVEYLEARRFAGNVMTPFEEGAFVIWRLHPAVKVGLDSRYEVAYRPGVAEEIWRLYDGAEGWRATLARYPADLVLVKVTQALDRRLGEESGWSRVYQDDVYRLYARPGLLLPPADRRGAAIEARFP